MNKKEFKEKMDLEDKTLINFHPELNQSSLYDNEGNLLPKERRESFSYMPNGFINSGLSRMLTKKDRDIYDFLASKCSWWRNTRKTNPDITEETGIQKITIDRSLRRLEFYHFINRRPYSMGPKSKRRIITLLRWDTAYQLLVREGKIEAISSKDTNPIITPYLPKKFKKSDPK
ncbi:hypothetical protein ES695_02115 [Candidatus Atribacteria bacterium 1244-E10-H5-B2]|jgi:hypothetical protein|nr:MAG: hypothetical protein ES695_02115 [Candidatus Atribacteria bacterium 1244-E10-H5-B2]